MKKGNKLLCLDFDDCLINWELLREFQNNRVIMELENTTPEKEFLKTVDINFKIIRNVAEKYKFNIFITSSWSIMMDINLNLKKGVVLNEIEKKILSIIKKNIGHLVVGVDFKRKKKSVMNNRVLTVKELADKYKQIVVIDDLDLYSDFKNLKNVFFIRVINEIIYHQNRIWGNLFKLDKYFSEKIISLTRAPNNSPSL